MYVGHFLGGGISSSSGQRPLGNGLKARPSGQLIDGFIALINRQLAVGHGEGKNDHGRAVGTPVATVRPGAIRLLFGYVFLVHPLGVLCPKTTSELEHGLGVVVVGVVLVGVVDNVLPMFEDVVSRPRSRFGAMVSAQ